MSLLQLRVLVIFTFFCDFEQIFYKYLLNWEPMEYYYVTTKWDDLGSSIFEEVFAHHCTVATDYIKYYLDYDV